MRLAFFFVAQDVSMKQLVSDPWRAYLLRCCDGSLYAGVSNDVRRRLEHHNAGRGAKYTRARLPVKLVWRSVPLEKSTAHRLEARMKRLPRAKKLILSGPANLARRQLVRELLLQVKA
jgi:putative endonuclease